VIDYKSLGWSPLVQKVTTIESSPSLKSRTQPNSMIYSNTNAESPRGGSQKKTTPALKSINTESPKSPGSPDRMYLNSLQNSTRKTKGPGCKISDAQTIQESNTFSAFNPDLGRLTEENTPVGFDGISMLFSDDSPDQSLPDSPSTVSHSLRKSHGFELRLGPVLEVDSSRFLDLAGKEAQDGTPTPKMVPIKKTSNFF
jgi:hypothetical protein